MLLICGVSFLPKLAHAGNTLTMEQAVSAAMDANPLLKAASSDHDAASARPPQAATPPDPNFMVQFTQVPINTVDVGQGTITYMVQQKIPFPSKLVYGYKAEKRAAEASGSRVQLTAQEIIRQIKLHYLEVYRLQEEAVIEKRTLSSYRTNKSSAEAAYAADEGGLADAVRATVDMGDVEAKLAIVEQDRLAALARLSQLMAKQLTPDTKVKRPSELKPLAKLNHLIERAQGTRPEIKETEHLIRSQDAKVSLAKSQFGPDLTLRWGYDDRPNNQQNAWTGRVMMSVPLWALSKQRFQVREAKAMLKRAKSLNEEATLNTKAQVKEAFARYKAAKKRKDIYAGKVVPRAQTLLKSSRESYRSGDGDFLSIVDSIRSLRSAQLELVRARVDEQRAYADLERAVGASPSREGS
jgi:outer membrane protein TolC